MPLSLQRELVAVDNLALPNFGCNHSESRLRRVLILKRAEQGGIAMGVALQINFALWIMIGCIAMKVAQFVEYVN
jgi:hypothetical protein